MIFLAQEKFRKENVQTGFVVAKGGFLSYWRRDSDFKNNFVIMKRER